MDLQLLGKSVDAVLFDMDGTLVDTERLFIDLMAEYSREMGAPLDEGVLLETIGVSVADTRTFILARYGADYPYDAVYARFAARKRELAESGAMPVKDGGIEVVRRLQARGLPLGVVSSSYRRTVGMYIRSLGLDDAFGVIVCGDEVPHPKPAPDMLVRAADLLGVESGRILVVEDSEHGLCAAAAAGCIPLLVKDILYPPDEARRLAYREYDSLRGLLRDLEGA